MSADEELGYVYLPIESALDYYGGTHPGDNLFSDSIVCLDARTGKRIWHFQGNRHGIWDYDFTAAPVLADVTVNGRKVNVLVETSKQGFAYVLDRVTGQPIWPIEDRPVPKGHVPGEWYAPTQPFPTRPPAFEQQGVTIDDLIDFTPELRREAIEIISQYNYGPLYTPLEVPGTAEGKNGTILMPSYFGGNNVNGAAFDPDTGILYVPTIRLAVILQLVKSEHPDSNLPYVFERMPTAGCAVRRDCPVRSNRRTAVWSRSISTKARSCGGWRMATVRAIIPPSKHLNLPRLGQPARPTPLVTKTLLFLGEGASTGGSFGLPADGKMFRAYDKATGEVVWEMELPGGTSSAPMTYMLGGKQYLVIAVAWRNMPAELIALALP